MQDKENREVKNSVFVELFYADESAEENDIALFNAIHDEPLSEGTIIRRFKVAQQSICIFRTIFPLMQVENYLYLMSISPPLMKICLSAVFYISVVPMSR